MNSNSTVDVDSILPMAGNGAMALITAPDPSPGDEEDPTIARQILEARYANVLGGDRHRSTTDIREHVLVLKSLRRGLRRDLANVSTYKSITSINLPKGHDVRVRYSGINLLHGEHLKLHAKTWADVNPRGRKLLTTYLNALANATGSKRFSIHKEGSKAAATKQAPKDAEYLPKALFYIETLWAPRSHINGQTSRTPIGYRLHGVLYIEGKRLLDGMNAARKKAKIAELASVDEAYALWYPLARGFMRSFEEAKQFQLKVEALRAKSRAAEKAKNRKRNGAPVVDPIEEELDKPTPLALDPSTPQLEALMAYEWSQYTGGVEFYYDAVTKYLKPQNYVVAYPAQLTPGRILDPRPYLNMDGSRDDDARSIPLDHRDNPINPDLIFNKESLMSFFMYSGKETPIVDPQQTQLELYAAPAVAPEDNEDGMDVVDRPAPEEEEEEEELLDGNDPALRAFNGETAAAAAPRPYQTKLIQNLELRLPDTILPQFPYEGSTYLLNNDFLFIETFALLALPYEMGKPVNEARINASSPAPDEQLLKKQTAAVLTLKKLEEIRRNIESAGDRREFIAHALECSNEYMETVTTNFEKIVKEITSDRVVAIINEQRSVMAMAIHREADRIRNGAYDAVLVDSREKQSTDEYMAITDFMPDGSDAHGHTGSDRASQLKRHIMDHLRNAEHGKARYHPSERDKTTNDILHGDIDTINVPTEELLAHIEERQEVDKSFEKSAEEIYEQVNKYIDNVDTDFAKRDDILSFRIHAQTLFGMAAYKTKHALSELPPTTTHQQLLNYANLVQKDVWNMRVQLGEELLDKLKTSNNIPESLSREFREFLTKTCTPSGMAGVFAHEDARNEFDHKPFVAFIQWMQDILFGICKASPNSFRALQAAIFGGLDAHTFGIDRSEPAINPIFIGDTGIGKSWILRMVGLLASPGTCRHFTNVTPNTFNTETSFDSLLMIFEEMKSRWLYMSDDVKDKGASDELNFLKDRLTRFFTSTDSWYRDDATGRRSVIKSRSSHQNSTIGASNQDLTNMDKNVARRFVIWFVPKQLNNDSVSPEQLKTFDEYESTDTGKTAIRRQQMIHALYVVVRNMMKGGVIPSPPTNSARFYLRCILSKLQARGVDVGGSTKFHQVIQLAENIQLYFACWMALFSPLAAKFFKEPGSPEMWSAEAILKLVTPFIPTTKDALVYALTLFDFVYCPTYVEHILKDLARDGLHFADPAQWSYRTTPGRERKDPLIYDVQYLCFSGRTPKEIYGRIAGFNHDFELRDDEVGLLLTSLMRKHITCPQFIGINMDGVNRPAFIERNANKTVNLPVMGIEEDHTKTGGKHYRLYILINFLEQRIGINFDDPQMRNKLSVNHPEFVASEFKMGTAATLCQIKTGYSMITDAISEVFANPVLEKMPNEGRNQPRPAVFEFVTSYMPVTVTLKQQHPNAKDDKGFPKMLYKRVSLHGTPMMLRVDRDSLKAPICQMNHAILLPTAKNTLKRMRDPANEAANIRAEKMGETTGMMMGKSDMDYSQNCEYMRLVCHPGIEMAFRYLKIPESMWGLAAYRFPLGFAPLNYRLSRQIALADKIEDCEDYIKEYPAFNIYARVKDHVNMIRSEFDPKSVTTVDVEDMMGMGSFGGNTFIPAINAETGLPTKIVGVPEVDAIDAFRFHFDDDKPDDAMDIDEIATPRYNSFGYNRNKRTSRR